MKTFFKILFLASWFLALQASGQDVADYRGGWIKDIDGTRHIYYIVLRNNTITGYYCIECKNPENLAFIDDGVMHDNGLEFYLYHYPVNHTSYREKVRALLRGSELVMSKQRQDSDQISEISLHRAPVNDPLPMTDWTPNRPFGSIDRVLPGPVEIVTPDKVLGLWLWGTGPGKQYFIFRRHKDQIRGMVCGPCDSVADMAPLEGIRMTGTNFHFEIVHEDNGIGFEIHGPHSNVTDATISRNEMLMDVIPSFEPQTFKPIQMTLLGPIQFQSETD